MQGKLTLFSFVETSFTRRNSRLILGDPLTFTSNSHRYSCFPIYHHCFHQPFLICKFLNAYSIVTERTLSNAFFKFLQKAFDKVVSEGTRSVSRKLMKVVMTGEDVIRVQRISFESVLVCECTFSR